MKETPSQVNLFTGKLDLDSEARSVKDNDYTNALNIRNGISRDGNYGEVQSMRGNTLVPYTQPNGSNGTLGSLENKATRLVYSWHYNSQGNMEIRESNIDTRTVVPVAEYNFGWGADKYVSNTDIVDDKLLFWTDTKPKRINFQKSRRDKIHEGNIYFVSPNNPFVPVGTDIEITVFDGDNNVVQIANYTTPSDVTKENYAEVVALFITNTFTGVMTADRCSDYVEVTFVQQGYYTLFISITSPVEAIYVPQNYYESITETIVDAGKYPLNCPPTLQIKQDDERAGFNNIERTTWQFATQVIYDDYDESTLSPYSDIAYINCAQRGNYIEVDFTDIRLNNAIGLSIISKIKILARPDNTGKWREVATIDQSELWNNSGALGTNSYRFYNDGQYTVIDDATATLAYSAMPIEVIGTEYDMGEENADNRIMYSKFVENYDAPCIDATLTPEFTEYPKEDHEITVGVRIYNNQQFFAGGVGFPYSEGQIGAIYRIEDNGFPIFGGACDRNVQTAPSGYDGQQILPEGGFVGYLAGTNYFAISKQNRTGGTLTYTSDDVIDATTTSLQTQLTNWYDDYNTTNGAIGDMVSFLTIKGVKKGKYVFRLASHWCSFDDKASKGQYYDLNNGQAYQKTSTNVRSINVVDENGASVSDFDGTELIIELDGNGNITLSNFNGVLTSWNSANKSYYIGDFRVEDLTVPNSTVDADLVFKNNMSFYVTDSNGNTDLESVRNAVRTELCRVIMPFGASLDSRYDSSLGGIGITLITDHNGYQYYKGEPTLISIGGGIWDDKFPVFSIAYGTEEGRNNISDDFFKSEDGTDNSSILRSIYEDELYVSKNYFIDSSKHQQGYIFTTNTNFTDNCRTLVTGTVTDSGGTGLQGVPVVITRNNRNEVTQSDGTFSIIVYEDGIQNLNQRIFDQIIFNTNDCAVITFPSGNTWDSYQLSIFNIGVDYTNTIPYAPNFLNDVVCLTVFFLSRKLKAGGRYNFGLYHVDKLNRRHALVTQGLDIRIPFLTEQREDYFDNVGTGNSNGVFEFTLNVTSTPPSWADKLYVVRTQDEYYSDYLQFPLWNAKYVIQYDDANSIPIETTYNSFSANEIYLGFPKATTAYKEFNSASNKGWTFQDGDRVRFIANQDGQLYSTLLDLPIKAQRSDSVDEFVYYVIDNLDTLGEVQAGCLVEVYRPRKAVDDEVQLFFEIHQCIDIVNGAYVGLPLDLSTGDTYTRNRTVPIQNGVETVFIEDNSISDNWISKQQDIGRVVVKDERFGRLERPNAVRFSNQYIAGSRLNGLARFEPLNVVEFPRQYGAINKMILVNDNAERQVILSVCENNAFTIYVGEILYSDLRGQDVIALSNKVLGSYRTLQGDYGTKNPESFAWKDGQVFWWDENRGAFARYDNNGVDDISQIGLQLYTLQIQFGTKVIGVYDDYYAEYVAYPKQDNLNAVGYYSDKKGWNSFYSFKPEMFGTSAELILSWINGNLYVHDDNANACEFYGARTSADNPSITFVSKLNPLAIKIAQCMRVKASNVWYAPSITTVPNASYRLGMSSRIKKGNWKVFESDIWADVLGNLNDPQFATPEEALLRGERLRGDAFIIKLENDYIDTITGIYTVQTLRSAELFVVSSENTK